MSRKSFLTVTDASTVTFDADQSKNFQVTLAGSRSLVIAGGQDGDEISILLIQGGSGSYTATWPSTVSFAAKQAPSLNTAVGNSDLITLVKRGSTWQDVGGAPSRAPARLIAVGLATTFVLGTGAGMVGSRLNLSQGGGEGIGNLPTALEVRSKSGAELLTKIDGSGSALIGSGILAVGTIRSDGADAKFKVANNGATTVKAAISGASITINAPTAGLGQAACIKTTGTIGYCSTTPTNGTCTCN